jgi:tripartite-type tricarboxylate transporter receptor subunit TctC
MDRREAGRRLWAQPAKGSFGAKDKVTGSLHEEASMRRPRSVTALILAVLSGCVAPPSFASDQWPQQPVRIIVPVAAGGALDTAARLLADGLTKRWDRPVVVENKPGAETTIGAAAFAAARDRHTLLYAAFGTLTVAPLTIEKLSFDPKGDLVPLVPVASIVVAVSVSNNLSVTSLADLEALIRAKPGQLAWASAPTMPRYVFAFFLRQRGLEMNYVAYRDLSQPQVDLGEGRIQALITSVAASRAPVAAGKARFLAVTEPRRTSVLPDVPTAAEVGYDEFTFVGGAGLFGWKDMPQAIRDRIVTDVNAVLGDPEVREKFKAAGQEVIGGGHELLGDLLAKQRARVLEISKFIDLKSAK